MAELEFVSRHLTPTIPSLIASRQSIVASIQKLPDSAANSVSRFRHR